MADRLWVIKEKSAVIQTQTQGKRNQTVAARSVLRSAPPASPEFACTIVNQPHRTCTPVSSPGR